MSAVNSGGEILRASAKIESRAARRRGHEVADGFISGGCTGERSCWPADGPAFAFSLTFCCTSNGYDANYVALLYYYSDLCWVCGTIGLSDLCDPTGV